MDDMVPLRSGAVLPFLEVNQALQAIKRVAQKKPELLQELLRYVSQGGNKDELRPKLYRELFDIGEEIYFFEWKEEKDTHVMYAPMASVLRSALEEKDGKVYIGDHIDRR